MKLLSFRPNHVWSRLLPALLLSMIVAQSTFASILDLRYWTGNGTGSKVGVGSGGILPTSWSFQGLSVSTPLTKGRVGYGIEIQQFSAKDKGIATDTPFFTHKLTSVIPQAEIRTPALHRRFPLMAALHLGLGVFQHKEFWNYGYYYDGSPGVDSSGLTPIFKLSSVLHLPIGQYLQAHTAASLYIHAYGQPHFRNYATISAGIGVTL